MLQYEYGMRGKAAVHRRRNSKATKNGDQGEAENRHCYLLWWFGYYINGRFCRICEKGSKFRTCELLVFIVFFKTCEWMRKILILEILGSKSCFSMAYYIHNATREFLW
jgi:hypothetical protein